MCIASGRTLNKPTILKDVASLLPVSDWDGVVAQPESVASQPDGFVSQDKQWLHFAFDDNRHRAVYYSAKLPSLP